MKDLKRLDEALDRLHTDFNTQLNAIQSDSKEFHTSIVDLVAKYPEHKEIINFTIFVNDKLETNQRIFSDVVTESFNEIIKNKRMLVQAIIDSHKDLENKSGFKKTLESLSSLADFKMIFISIAVIVLVIGVLIVPSQLVEVLQTVIKIIL